MPGYGDTHRYFQKYKKGLAMTSHEMVIVSGRKRALAMEGVLVGQGGQTLA